MLNEDRKKELGNQFVMQGDGSDGALHCLEIQELLFLCVFTSKLRENPPEGYETIDYEAKIKNFYRIVMEKLKAGYELFVAYNQITNYPHIDNAGFGWVFSKREFAEAAVEYYKERAVNLTIKQIRNEQIREEFLFFHRIGMEQLLLDNGQYPLLINREDVTPAPDFTDCASEDIPVTNPKTNFALLHFLETLYSKEEIKDKQKFLQALEARMMHCLLETKYLIPVKVSPGTAEKKQGEAWVLPDGVSAEFATMMDQRDHTVWLPVFTDWEEALKMYPKEEWEECVGSYDMVTALSEQMNGFLINVKGAPLRANKKHQERFAAFRRMLEQNQKN